jgi:IS605 OrfB family transposase
MPSGGEGALTLTIKMRVSPEPGQYQALLDLMKRYRDALNHTVRVAIENKALSLGKAHELLYSVLKERYGLPSKVAQDCYREAIAIAKSWLSNPNRGRVPKARTPRLWLTHRYSYRVKDGYVEILGGYKLEIAGWDMRYDSYPSGDARLLLKDTKLILEVSKRVPRPTKYAPKGALAVDVNEKLIIVGNSRVELRLETLTERALRCKRLAEELQKKYSSTRYSAWLRRRGVLNRIKHFHRKARNIIEDWAKKTSHKIATLAKQHQYAVAREDLTGLVESLRKLPKQHRVALLILSYRSLERWIDWQCEKSGVPLIVVGPRGTSSTCPMCNFKLVENGYRRLRCPTCGFEADRDTVAVLNIERRALSKMWGAPTPLNAPQMTDVNPNRWGEPMKPPKGNPRPLGWGGGQLLHRERRSAIDAHL